MLTSVVQKGSNTDFWEKINFKKKKAENQNAKGKVFCRFTKKKSGKTILTLSLNKITAFLHTGKEACQSVWITAKYSTTWEIISYTGENVALVQKL